jgi:hypothetical protein
MKRSAHHPIEHYRQRRAGAALYSLVAFNALLVGLLGLSALSVVRIERSRNLASSDLLHARRQARTAVELAALDIKQDPRWRVRYTHDFETKPSSFHKGTLSWKLNDLVDGNLASNAEDGILIQGIGRAGEAVWVETVQAIPAGGPPEALQMSLHAAGRVRIGNVGHLVAGGAPVSTNGELRIDGTVYGNAECESKTGSGGVTGTLSVDQPPKGMPPSGVFQLYRDMALPLAYQGNVEGHLLSPGVNTYGNETNPYGLYYINTGGSLLTVRGSRIHGTLLVEGNVRIDAQALLHTARRDYPVLIVKGDLTVSTSSATDDLREADWNRNFNPPGAPYMGSTNDNQEDVYPNEIRGLVHVIGNVTFENTPRLAGMVWCEGEVNSPGQARIQHDATLPEDPPLGYESAAGPEMKLLRHTRQRGPAP